MVWKNLSISTEFTEFSAAGGALPSPDLLSWGGGAGSLSLM